MKDSVRDSYAAVLFYMHEYNLLPNEISPTFKLPYNKLSIAQLINCTDDALLNKAKELFVNQRDHISGYEVDFGKDDMLNEIVYLDLAWSGDALWAIECSEYYEDTDTYQLGYYVPKSGSNIWYDGWVIPKNSNNKLASMMFIDFLSKPSNAIKNSIFIGYTSAVAKNLMQSDSTVCQIIEENEYDIDEYFNDIGRYPNVDDTLGVMRDYGNRNELVVNMWQSSKAGNNVSLILIYCLISIIIFIVLVISLYYIKEFVKLKKKK